MGKRFTEKGFYFEDAGKTILIGCSDAKAGLVKIPATVVVIEAAAFRGRGTITDIDFSAWYTT